MNKYEIPIVLVGNNTDESQRKVSYEEAKNFSDNYGLKYHETTMENNYIKMKDIFRDLGEQVLYQDILYKTKNNEKEKNMETYRTKDNKDIKIKSKTDIKKDFITEKKRRSSKGKKNKRRKRNEIMV